MQKVSRWMKVVEFMLWTSFIAFGQSSGAQVPHDWVRGNAEDGGIATKQLGNLESAIRAGEFKKIGSILIARHGKLVYENYFDGDANSLRDTRSATKSITDILVGIAIDEKKLKGVDERVLVLLPEHAKRMQNPDPRK